ncbi:MAG: hypothetical protein KIT72_06020 [Polyangiaceae bacterium]|nr:hypothetical protein [Polyangiaceae bacterium]MCW5789957.1 hypothetical protein [Polyangiaceae bacterium]
MARSARTTSPAVPRRSPSAAARVRRASSRAPLMVQGTQPPEPGTLRLRRLFGPTLSSLALLFTEAEASRLDGSEALSAAEQAAVELRQLAQQVGGPVRFAYVGGLPYVAGELLETDRAGYLVAQEVGERLAAVGVTLLVVSAEVTSHDLLELMRAWLRAVGGEPLVTPPRVALGRAPELTFQPPGAHGESQAERSLQLYALSLAQLEQLYAGAATRELPPLRALRRLAQRWAMAALSGEESFLQLHAFASRATSAHERALQSAVLLLALARQLTRDRRLLAELALAALLAPLPGVWGAPEVREADQRLEHAAQLMLQAGSWHPSGWFRAALVMEATWLGASELGPLYRGRAQGLLGARLLHLVQRYVARVAAHGVEPSGVTPAAALTALFEERVEHPSLVRLLARAIGVIPTGSVVELSEGEWAVVAAPSAMGDVERPAVAVVTDSEGRALSPPAVVDLAQTSLSGLRRLVPPAEVGFDPGSAFFGEEY